MPEIPRDKLRAWATTNTSVAVLYVFGSYARGEDHTGSDLDLAFDLAPVDGESLAELIQHAARWKRELTALTGIIVKDLYMRDMPEVSGPVIEVYRR